MKRLVNLLAVVLVAVGFMAVSVKGVLAVKLITTQVRYDRLQTGTASNVQVNFVPGTVAGVTKVRVIFDTAVLGTGFSVTITNLNTGATGLPGTLTIAKVGTSAVDVSGLTALTIGTTYGFNISTGITTGAAGAAKDIVQTLTAGSAVVENATVANYFVSTNGDQIVITANVPPTFTFSIGGTADAFTQDLSSTSVVSTSGQTVSISTNAAKGWTAWVKSQNAALTSATSGESIGTTGVIDGTPSTCVNGTDCYLLSAAITTNGTGAGSLAIAPEYLGVGTSSGGTLSTSLQPFASRTGKTNGDVITLYGRASMIATKAAANDYTDTWTIVAAGNF